MKNKVKVLVKQTAKTNIRGFYSGYICKQLDIEKEECEKDLQELVKKGMIEEKYILRNPHNSNEQKIYMYEEIPFGEYYDDFQKGEEFIVSEENIETYYVITKQYKEKVTRGDTNV